MTEDLREYADFADLRQVAIDYAQQASGQIWTDFNLHDPGVTLLEQSCFALTEIAYRVAHADRDLLTDQRGHFNFHDLALFTPRKVLNTDPVTATDLEAWLADCPDVARVLVTPVTDAPAGLYDLLIVPATDDVDADVLRDRVARAFDAVRPLCCDRDRVRVARSRPMRLTGRVEIMSDTLPEFAAAQLYHAVSILLRGASPRIGQKGATRQDAYDAPLTLLHQPDRHQGGTTLEDHLGDLRGLPAIRDIGLLQLDQIDSAPQAEGPVYPVLHLPRDAHEIGLVLILDGVPVHLDPIRLREEYIRIAAERIALAHHHLDAGDWQVMRPGRRRDFTHRSVDSLLPIIYREAAAREGAGQATLSAYRQGIDGHLAALNSDLADLPRFFAAGTDMPAHDPQGWRQKLALLDYLIALQGEEMPAIRHTGLNLYHGASARHRFALEWRLRYLYALPRLNAARLTGPGARGPGGFLGRIALLADLDPVMAPGDDLPLTRYGLRIDAAADPGDEVRVDAPHLPADPLDMLGVGDEVEPLSPADLARFRVWGPDGALSSDRFLRLADGQNLFLAPMEQGWQVLFQDQPAAAPLHLAQFDDLGAARRALSALRSTWRMLHRDSEQVALVEPALLREPSDFAPHSAHLVLTGWTARGKMPAFRAFVGQLIAQHAPAHLLIRPCWLSFDQTLRFHKLRARIAAGEAGARTALAGFLADLEVA